jgi:hypothetical protein
MEHELFATVKKEQAAVIHLTPLHPNRTWDVDRHREAHFAPRGHAVLHDTLIDLLAKDVAMGSGQLHERTLGRTGGELTVVLTPLLDGSGMELNVAKVVYMDISHNMRKPLKYYCFYPYLFADIRKIKELSKIP